MPRGKKLEKIVIKTVRKRVSKKDAETKSSEPEQKDNNLTPIVETKEITNIIEPLNITPEKIEEVKQKELKEVGKIYTLADGRQYTYRISKGQRKSKKTGVVKDFEYKKIQFINNNKMKRGPKCDEGKLTIKRLLPNLKESDCLKILDYINNNIVKANNGCQTDIREENIIQTVL
jgi:hypothetical protein